MWNKIKHLLMPFLGYLIILSCILAVITILALFGGVYMHLFGFQYESVPSLVLYFIIVSVISLPLEAFSNFLTNLMIHIGVAKKSYGLFYIFIDACSCFVVMQIVDFFMPSIVSSKLSIILFALTMSLITIYGEKKGIL